MKRAALLVALATALVACSSRDAGPRRDDCTCAGEPVVDAALLAFLSKARAVHHEADLAELANDVPKAIAALERLLAGSRPARGAALPPEAAEVLADTHARLADLRSRVGAFAAAQRDVDDGLALAQKPTHFRGHLFEVRGVVHERQAKALEASGDAAGAARAKASAVDAFEAAIKIQDQVIDEALSGRARGSDGG